MLTFSVPYLEVAEAGKVAEVISEELMRQLGDSNKVSYHRRENL